MLASDTDGQNMISSRNSNVVSNFPKYDSQAVGNRHRLLSGNEPSLNNNYGSGASA